MLELNQIYLLVLVFLCFLFCEVVASSYKFYWNLYAKLAEIVCGLIGLFFAYRYKQLYFYVAIAVVVYVAYFSAGRLVWLVKNKFRRRVFLHGFMSSDYFPVGPKITACKNKQVFLDDVSAELPVPAIQLKESCEFFGRYSESKSKIQVINDYCEEHHSFFEYCWYYYGNSEPSRFSDSRVECEIQTLSYNDGQDVRLFSVLKHCISQYLFCTYFLPELPEDDSYSYDEVEGEGFLVYFEDEIKGIVVFSKKKYDYWEDFYICRAINETKILVLRLGGGDVLESREDNVSLFAGIVNNFMVDGEPVFDVAFDDILCCRERARPAAKPAKFDLEYKDLWELKTAYRKHASDPIAWYVFEMSENYGGWINSQWKQHRVKFEKKLDDYVADSMNNFDAFASCCCER